MSEDQEPFLVNLMKKVFITELYKNQGLEESLRQKKMQNPLESWEAKNHSAFCLLNKDSPCGTVFTNPFDYDNVMRIECGIAAELQICRNGRKALGLVTSKGT